MSKTKTLKSWKGKESIKSGTHFKIGNKLHPYSRKFTEHLLKTRKKKTRENDYCKKREKCSNPNVDIKPEREAMPQFNSITDIRKFDKQMAKMGYSNKDTTILSLNLKPSQKEINNDKINEIADSLMKKERREKKQEVPIVITKDGSIIDGHHRAFAYKILIERGELPKSHRVKVHQYNAKPKQTLMLANSLGYNKNPHKF